MGNQIDLDDKSKFDGGYLYVRTDRPYYYPGNTVNGKIYLRVERPLKAECLSLHVRGKENTVFWTYNGQTSQRHYTKKIIIDYKQSNAYKFAEDLQPGDYIFQFEFDLPPSIPGSLEFDDKYMGSEQSAKIRYTIKASITTPDPNTTLIYKQWLIVSEQPVTFQENHVEKNLFNVTTCGCLGNGALEVTAKFNKNVFFSNETATVDIAVNNKDGVFPVNEVKFEVLQKLELLNGERDTKSCIAEQKAQKQVLVNSDKTFI